METPEFRARQKGMHRKMADAGSFTIAETGNNLTVHPVRMD